MITSEQVKTQFLAELRALCEKWNADFSAKDEYSGYSEYGEDIRIRVYIPSVYDKNGECEREWTEIDLGNWFDKDKND